jgi:hypothetical protein
MLARNQSLKRDLQPVTETKCIPMRKFIGILLDE